MVRPHRGPMSERVVMVASSYPRFAGDSVGSFMEPIARGIAARGHEVHLVAPWHPKWNRPKVDSGVHFHLFRYTPVEALNTFGYAEGMRADVRLRASAVAVAPPRRDRCRSSSVFTVQTCSSPNVILLPGSQRTPRSGKRAG